MPVVLTYWSARGLTEPIRALLDYVGEDWQDKRLKVSDGEKWFAQKAKLGEQFYFPNLPYLVDGDVKLTQSLAIIRYVKNRKFDARQFTTNSDLFSLLVIWLANTTWLQTTKLKRS